MKLENAIIEKWKKDIEFCLPGLLGALEKQKSSTFLIGASLVDIYMMQGWFKKFSRSTGDADFTIEYFGDPREYIAVCSELVAIGYRKDDLHPYRYHPKKVAGTYAYVDLLTFTTNPDLEEKARAVMNVGVDFNFEGMSFAKHCPLQIEGNIYLPNPLALIYLKMRSYYHAPDRRKKDLVDLVEVILRLSTESSIFKELNEVMKTCSDQSVKDQIKKMCSDIESDKGGVWDLEDIKSNMEERNLLAEFDWDELPKFFEFFRINIFKA